VAGVYVLCALVMVGATVALTRNARIGWNDAAFGALVAAFPNTGFMGVPLLVALLGAQSAGPAIVTIVVDMVITSSLCIALSRLDGAGTHGVGVALRSAFKGMATNPMPWSIALGALASALQFSCRARWTRPWPCWPTPPRPWRCSPSAPCWPARR
jgi:malonate transporter